MNILRKAVSLIGKSISVFEKSGSALEQTLESLDNPVFYEDSLDHLLHSRELSSSTLHCGLPIDGWAISPRIQHPELETEESKRLVD